MGIYVDKLKEYPLGTVPEAARAKYWCHMWADSIQELHMMAGRIGSRREWFQDHETLPHYDLTQKFRRRAVSFGAIEIEVLPWLRKMRSSKTTSSKST